MIDIADNLEPVFPDQPCFNQDRKHDRYKRMLEFHKKLKQMTEEEVEKEVERINRERREVMEAIRERERILSSTNAYHNARVRPENSEEVMRLQRDLIARVEKLLTVLRDAVKNESKPDPVGSSEPDQDDNSESNEGEDDKLPLI
ncbi:hypothetical protein B5807_00050 [Epicoccum nigrum]|uniref:Uncharacterized protein n=1 Tax=Epicoccum nigrum TaxID=105696 RepID=A0A1Y2MF37_EPING|nr:hypothetical protein B5807_00050 [Epicoccum nigrum]